MGLLSKLLKGSSEPKEKKNLPWIVLNSTEQIEHIIEASKAKPQLVFKHSTRCGISRMVKNAFEAEYNLDKASVDLYYLDLLSYRETSNAVAEQFNVMHESPQLLIIKNGAVLAHESHGAINDLSLEEFV